ncbi:MAG: hypothetical protein HYZ53_00160 [Planctomycetes bacterium]|nr:hypothetical protein [Planctomycetota bacterium]
MKTACPACKEECEVAGLPAPCPACGANLPVPAPHRPAVSGLAVASFVLGILSLFALCFSALGIWWFMLR